MKHDSTIYQINRHTLQSILQLTHQTTSPFGLVCSSKTNVIDGFIPLALDRPAPIMTSANTTNSDAEHTWLDSSSALIRNHSLMQALQSGHSKAIGFFHANAVTTKQADVLNKLFQTLHLHLFSSNSDSTTHLYIQQDTKGRLDCHTWRIDQTELENIPLQLAEDGQQT